MTVALDQELVSAVHRGRWRTLGVLCLSLMIVMIANASLNVALPELARGLDASTSALQWMVDAYALVFAALLFVGGAIGDRFGRKGALQGGLALFLVTAVLATTADSAGALVAARAAMGVAAALVMPATLAILTTVFPAAERGRAISLWAGVAAGGAALGPVTAGLLLERYWWGSVFLVNVPLVVAALVAGRRLVPTSRDPDGRPFDLVGAAWSILGLGGVVLVIIEAPRHGWTSPPTLAVLGCAGLALALFVRRELTTTHPMLDLRLFTDRRVSTSSAGIAVTFFAMFGTFFLVTQYVQLVLGHSPVGASLVVLPMSVGILALALRVPPLVERLGAARVVAVGLALFALGMAMLAGLGTTSPLWLVVMSFAPMAVGMAMTGPPLSTLLMSSVPAGRAGVGSALNDTSRELGGALGVAVLGSLATTAFTSSLEPSLTGLVPGERVVARSGLAGALDLARDLPGDTGSALATAARAAFVEGFDMATLTAAVVLLVSSLAAWRLVPSPPTDTSGARPLRAAKRSAGRRGSGPVRGAAPAVEQNGGDETAPRPAPRSRQGSGRPSRIYGTTTYAYDALDRLILEHLPEAAPTATPTTGWATSPR